MKSLTKLVNGIPKMIGLGLAGAILYGSVSCATMTQAQKTSLLGSSLTILGSLNPPTSNTKEGRITKEILMTSGEILREQARMQESLEIAREGRNQTVINPPPSNYQNQNQSYNPPNSQNQNQNQSYNPPNYNSQNNISQNNSENRDNLTPIGLFMYRNFVDIKSDGVANREDFLDLNEPVYDLYNLESLIFSFNDASAGGIYNGQNLNLKIYNLNDGKIINYFDKQCISSGIQDFPCESLYFYESGKYKAVLNAGNSKTFSLDFEIIKAQAQISEIEKPEIKNYYDAQAPQGIFVYNDWIDLNKNEKHEKNEFTGLEKKIFNLDKEKMHVGLNVANKTGNVIFMTYTEKGELIGASVDPYQRIWAHFVGPTGDGSNRDFVDRMRERGPGKYKVVATFENKEFEKYSVDIEIVK